MVEKVTTEQRLKADIDETLLRAEAAAGVKSPVPRREWVRKRGENGET